MELWICLKCKNIVDNFYNIDDDPRIKISRQPSGRLLDDYPWKEYTTKCPNCNTPCKFIYRKRYGLDISDMGKTKKVDRWIEEYNSDTVIRFQSMSEKEQKKLNIKVLERIKDIIDKNKVKIRIPISEGNNKTIIIKTTIENFEEWINKSRLDINNFRCYNEGVDFEITKYLGSYINLIIELKCEEKFVSISKWNFELESYSGPVNGVSLFFECYNCKLPDDIRKKYNIPLPDFSNDEDYGHIYFVDGKPISDPKLLTGKEDMIQYPTNDGYFLHKFEELDFKELIQKCELF